MDPITLGLAIGAAKPLVSGIQSGIAAIGRQGAEALSGRGQHADNKQVVPGHEANFSALLFEQLYGIDSKAAAEFSEELSEQDESLNEYEKSLLALEEMVEDKDISPGLALLAYQNAARQA